MMKSDISLYPQAIGDRIECDGCLGTVLYIGPVGTKTGLWLGIDWDDALRGKHDGSYNGVQYFVARNDHSGSFVRPEKVHIGQSACEAVISRYSQNEDENLAQINRQMQIKLQQSMNAPFLEMVGFEKVFHKQSDLRTLKVVNLRLMNVNRGGDLALLCPNLIELDLSKNLFTNWTQIFQICQQLRFLQWLNVSENYMIMPDNYDTCKIETLKILVCGNMNLHWKEITRLNEVFNQLEELRCQFNKITAIDDNDGFQRLKVVDIQANIFDGDDVWSEVCKLNSAPNLEELIAENILLKRIHFSRFPDHNKVPIFLKLRKLFIGYNLIDNWESIEELNRLQNLERLRIAHNPIFESEDKNVIQQIIIAKIANLKILNGIHFDLTERRGAEYDYIKKYGLEWLKVKGTQAQINFLQIHRRYEELIEKYGEPELAELMVKPHTIQSQLATLQLCCAKKSLKKKVPLSLSVQKLSYLVQKLFNLPNKPHLVCIDCENPNIEIHLDDDLREIAMFSVKDGDIIIVRDA